MSHTSTLKQRVSRIIEGLCQRIDGPWGRMLQGVSDYYFKPEMKNIWGGHFNGQAEREKIIHAIIDCVGPQAVLETGTFRGDTTAYFDKNYSIPVYTMEKDLNRYGYCRARFLFSPKVRVLCGDSRLILDTLLTHGGFSASTVLFVYLDAHERGDLPLRDELQLIFASAQQAVVVIDDFRVPWDEGYGYDDYPGEGVLEMSYIADIVRDHGLAAFGPSVASERETGMRRGMAVLVQDGSLAARMKALSGLTEMPGIDGSLGR